MNIIEAIKSRRSIGRVKPDPVDRALIEQMLEAGTRAPNHYLTEPWKFIVMTGEGRKLLGRAYAEVAKAELKETDSEESANVLKKEEAKAYRAPVVIAVAASPSDHPNAIELEEYGAVYAAIQNMLLAAHALGLGAMWRTGKPAYHPKMKEILGLNERETLLGFLYVGYPDMEKAATPRNHFSTRTTWIDT
jgi:nitroreductase